MRCSDLEAMEMKEHHRASRQTQLRSPRRRWPVDAQPRWGGDTRAVRQTCDLEELLL